MDGDYVGGKTMHYSNHDRKSPIVFGLFAILVLMSGCSTESYRMKRAERLYREGQIYLAKGDQEKAMTKFQDSIEMAEMIGYKPGIAHNLNEMAIICTKQGEHGNARDLLVRALAIYRELAMSVEISKTMNNIASTYVRERDFHEALKRYDELIQWDRENNNDMGVAITLYNMGLVYHNHLRQPEEARKKYLEALEIFKSIGQDDQVRMIENILGDK
jgi:tetratricopeptide (TPR) repeat protein